MLRITSYKHLFKKAKNEIIERSNVYCTINPYKINRRSSQKLNCLHDFNSPQIEHFRNRPKNIFYIKIIYFIFQLI